MRVVVLILNVINAIIKENFWSDKKKKKKIGLALVKGGGWGGAGVQNLN